MCGIVVKSLLPDPPSSFTLIKNVLDSSMLFRWPHLPSLQLRATNVYDIGDVNSN